MTALEERVQRVIRILEQIPTQDRDVFLMRLVENLSCAAIAARTGLTVECVERRLKSARDYYARASCEHEEQLETPFTLIYFAERIRRRFY